MIDQLVLELVVLDPVVEVRRRRGSSRHVAGPTYRSLSRLVQVGCHRRGLWLASDADTATARLAFRRCVCGGRRAPRERPIDTMTVRRQAFRQHAIEIARFSLLERGGGLVEQQHVGPMRSARAQSRCAAARRRRARCSTRPLRRVRRQAGRCPPRSWLRECRPRRPIPPESDRSSPAAAFRAGNSGRCGSAITRASAAAAPSLRPAARCRRWRGTGMTCRSRTVR